MRALWSRNQVAARSTKQPRFHPPAFLRSSFLLRRSAQFSTSGSSSVETKAAPFVFTPENYKDPKLPSGLKVIELPIVLATDDSLAGYGKLVHNPDHFTTEKGTFEILKWPQPGWRPLDPGTGDEAGTTEGHFDVHWQGDYFYGKNLAIATMNNTYLEGLSTLPEFADHGSPPAAAGKEEQQKKEEKEREDCIHLWMSDYHPDGAQLFWPLEPIPFVVALGLPKYGDDMAPDKIVAFGIPRGKGVYFHPSTWHNGVYVSRKHAPARFLTRQGRVHARISANWAHEYNTLLKLPLS